MVISKALLIVLASGHNLATTAATASSHGIPTLEGATLANADGFPPNTKVVASSFGGEEATTTSNAGYKYSLRINVTVPLKLDRQSGEPVLDKCTEWPDWWDSNGYNFTWYGLRIQLPDDASTTGGQHFPATSYPLKEMGLVQQYNDTPPTTLLQYNITTKEAQPNIKINFNDRPIWDSYTFDFVDKGDVVTDGSDYQEFVNEMYGTIACYGKHTPGGGRQILNPAIPTMTISLQRFIEGGGAAPTPIPPSDAAGAKMGKIFSLGLAFITLVGTLIL